MKKLALILVFVLILGCAYAEPEKLRELENVNYIMYSNLLYTQLPDGCALMDYEGNLLTDAVYSDRFNYNSGLVKCFLLNANINCCGALYADGTHAVPFRYGDLKILSEDWVCGLAVREVTPASYDFQINRDGEKIPCLIDHVDIYNLSTGCMMTLPREQYQEVFVFEDNINIQNRTDGKVASYDAYMNFLGYTERDSLFSDEYFASEFNDVYKDGYLGATDADGNLVLDYEYEDIRWGGGKHVYIKDKRGNCGIADTKGNIIIEPQFDDIKTMFLTLPSGHDSQYGIDGYFVYEQDGKIGYVTRDGITCEAQYPAEETRVHGVTCSFTDGVNYNIVAADGVVTPVNDYLLVTPASFSGGYYFIVNDSQRNSGLIDWHGNVIFPCKYQRIDLSGDGRYALVKEDALGPTAIYPLDARPEAEPEAEIQVDFTVETPAIIPAATQAPAQAAAEDLLYKGSGIGSVALPDVDFSGMTAPRAPAEKTSGIGSVALPNVDMAGFRAGLAESPAEAENAAAQETGGYDACVSILKSARYLLSDDASAYGASVQVLLSSAAAMLAEHPAFGMVKAAGDLAAMDAAANASAVIALIDSVFSML